MAVFKSPLCGNHQQWIQQHSTVHCRDYHSYCVSRSRTAVGLIGERARNSQRELAVSVHEGCHPHIVRQKVDI